MIEQSVNVTLQQATICHPKSIASLSDTSSIQYEDEYSFLSDNSLTQQHLQISHVHLNPPQQNYQVRFYELRNYKTLTNGPYVGQQQNLKHKIMSLNIKQKTAWDRIARLPRCNNPIQLQVESQNEGVLFGKITQEENEIESSLYNNKGEKIAIFQYNLKLLNCKKNKSRVSLFLGQRQNTLHSVDFESQSQSTSRFKDMSHQEKFIKIEQQLSDRLGKIEEEDENKAEKITTMSTSSKVVRIIRRRKKLQSLSEQNSEIQQKGEQDCQLNLQEKVSSYRNPFLKTQKFLAEKEKEVDFMSLKRSKEQLGISFINLQEIIYPKYFKSKTQDNKKYDQQQIDQVIKVLNPEAKIKTYHISPSPIINYKDCGVGTYTPLSTLKTQIYQSYDSFIQKSMRKNGVQAKILKSTNLKHQKLSNFNKKRHQNELVKQSEYEGQSHRQNYTQKKNSLNKFFMTNREESKLQSSCEIQNKLKKKLMPKLNLSLQNKVLEIKVQQFPKIQQKIRKAQNNIVPISLEKIKSKKSQSCKERLQKIESQLISLSDSELFPQYNLIINNISLNFRKKTFGSKGLTITMNDTGYLTEKIIGNNLMWASKSYRFQRVTQNDEMSIDVRGESYEHLLNYGTVKIVFNDLLINKKQRYYQTFLLGEKEVLGTLILGYQILKKKDSMKNYIFPQEQKRKQYSQSQIKTIEDQNRQAKKIKKLQNYLNEDVKKKLPNPEVNKIKFKKYLGGKNIKIGRASRFQDSNLTNPGPGDYNLESDFSRHAHKQN